MSGPGLKGMRNGKFSQGAQNLKDEPGNLSDWTIKWFRLMRSGWQFWTETELIGYSSQKKMPAMLSTLAIWVGHFILSLFLHWCKDLFMGLKYIWEGAISATYSNMVTFSFQSPDRMVLADPHLGGCDKMMTSRPWVMNGIILCQSHVQLLEYRTNLYRSFSLTCTATSNIQEVGVICVEHVTDMQWTYRRSK